MTTIHCRGHTFFKSTIPSLNPPAFSGLIGWPVETTLPTEKDGMGASREYPRPEFFYEKNNRTQIDRLHPEREVSVLTKNSLRPRLRQASYLENRALPDPDMDPEGWTSIPIRCAGASKHGSGIMITGTVSITRPVSTTQIYARFGFTLPRYYRRSVWSGHQGTVRCAPS
ncbi:hypothetical protein BDZ89DRAFT_1066257 [Hymenopellis radicata]|nr:hypothetical protein BDZ89DRAFT_1066257 [Hymenopellis radicata]